jgi:putative transposase
MPHHVTQRGNGRAQVCFSGEDYALYKRLLVEHSRLADVGIWAWCLMPKHVHLILTPADADGLRHALAKVHRAYAGTIHARQKRTGHFWQGRFGAVAMDEDHLLSAVRYVGLNPVRAGLVKQAADWPWSSTRAHLTEEPDGVTDLRPMKDGCHRRQGCSICSARMSRLSTRCVRPRASVDRWAMMRFWTGLPSKSAKP